MNIDASNTSDQEMDFHLEQPMPRLERQTTSAVSGEDNVPNSRKRNRSRDRDDSHSGISGDETESEDYSDEETPRVENTLGSSERVSGTEQGVLRKCVICYYCNKLILV